MVQVIRTKQINIQHLYRTYLMTNVYIYLLRPQKTTMMKSIDST